MNFLFFLLRKILNELDGRMCLDLDKLSLNKLRKYRNSQNSNKIEINLDTDRSRDRKSSKILSHFYEFPDRQGCHSVASLVIGSGRTIVSTSQVGHTMLAMFEMISYKLRTM